MVRIRRDTILRRLIAARDLISKKKNWIQRAEAAKPVSDDPIDELIEYPGLESTDAKDPAATKFCAAGAIRRACLKDKPEHIDECFKRVRSALDPNDDYSCAEDVIINFNDDVGYAVHKEMIKGFNKAIKELKVELGV